MYSSNSSLNGNNLISYPNQAFCSRPFSFESNPTSKDAEPNCPFPPPPLSFFQFEDNEIFLHDFLHHHHHQSLEEVVEIPGKAGQGMSTMEQIPRKRSSKRDRHSKINTARGLRDRRMRLSLEVAKRFFGLQDMLGFDKASKTVEWLLNQAKVEIKQLAREKNINIHPSCSSVGAKSASSTSECEGVSGLDEVVVSGNQEHAVVKRRITKVSRKSAFNPVRREKARERARERTREKRTRRLQADESKQCNEGTNHHLNSLSSCWNPFETVEESAGTHQNQSVNANPSFDVVLAEAEAEERSSHAKEHSGTVQDMAHEDDSLLIMSKWSPTVMFNSLNNSGLILQQHQFAEFQSLGKPWEAYNNHI